MKGILTTLLFLYLALPASNDLERRFKPPVGFKRIQAPFGSFAAYLQALPLRSSNAQTRTFSGAVARTDPYTAAVVDMSIGETDLQQCADAVIRLRAEYLYKQKNYKAISFNFTSGFTCDFIHYADGYRYANERWVLQGKKDYSYANFMRYLTLVFSYAGTLSLEKELKAVTNANDIRIGDVFIKGGSPGHCFIVIDLVENSAHKKQFMLAQSFIPAQNIQVLRNGSPWFSLSAVAMIPYGELVKLKYLKRF